MQFIRIFNNYKALARFGCNFILIPNSISRKYSISKVVTRKKDLISKVLGYIPFINVAQTRLRVKGFILYESIADSINYVQFFHDFRMPDTFYSWFTITEMHIWLLMARFMAEGDDGRFVRNQIVDALWDDATQRSRKLGAVNPSDTRAKIAELSEQFHAALVAYDEGIQSDDVVLTGAIWRRMYQQQYVDPEHLENVVKYIRKQIQYLDGLSSEQLFKGNLTWQPL